ncbi:BrnT family toxin [Rhizobium sp. HT1-10]|uniref:BrnT family toxin n=1 Tax=Rhizobium sp. HT1-10 TaxID=3111638 RepID=UPI003C1FD71F
MQPVQREFEGFEWDESKRLLNIAKHSIDFIRAANALGQPHIEMPSDKQGEVRTLAICPDSQRLIAVVYTMRGSICRIISARAAHKNERRAYRQIYGG